MGLNQARTVALSQQQTEYLSRLVTEDSSFADVIHSHPSVQYTKDAITVDRQDAQMLSDFFSDRLARLGFDAAYRPNQEGVVLESLIDDLFDQILHFE